MSTAVLRIEVHDSTVSELTWQDLAHLPEAAQVAVEEFFPGRRGRAVWIRSLWEGLDLPLEICRVRVSSLDGRFSNTLSLRDMGERGMLCYGEGDGPLPPSSGGPFRLWVVGSTDTCDHVKSVGRLSLGGETGAVLGQWRKPQLAGLRRGGGGEWYRVCARSEVPHNGMLAQNVQGVPLVLAHSSGHILAFSAQCPHLGATFPLEAVLEGARLTCTRHLHRWDIFEGTCVEGGGPTLPRYPVKVEDGVVFVQLGVG